MYTLEEEEPLSMSLIPGCANIEAKFPSHFYQLNCKLTTNNFALVWRVLQSTLQPGGSLCVEHRNINGLNRTVSGSVTTSNLLRPEVPRCISLIVNIF